MPRKDKYYETRTVPNLTTKENVSVLLSKMQDVTKEGSGIKENQERTSASIEPDKDKGKANHGDDSI